MITKVIQYFGLFLSHNFFQIKKCDLFSENSIFRIPWLSRHTFSTWKNLMWNSSWARFVIATGEFISRRPSPTHANYSDKKITMTQSVITQNILTIFVYCLFYRLFDHPEIAWMYRRVCTRRQTVCSLFFWALRSLFFWVLRSPIFSHPHLRVSRAT